MWEAFGLNEVVPSEFGRVQPQLYGQHIHRTLDHRRRLRPAGASVGAKRGSRSHHGVRLVVDARHVVYTGRHLTCQEWQEHRDARIGADVREYPSTHPDQPPLARRAKLYLLNLAAPMRHSNQVFGARFDPLQWAAKAARECGDDDQLRSRTRLGPEPATPVRNQNSTVALIEPERGGDFRAQIEGRLAGYPNAQPAGLGKYKDGLRLHGDWCQALIDEAALNRHLRPLEGILVAA